MLHPGSRVTKLALNDFDLFAWISFYAFLLGVVVLCIAWLRKKY